MKTLCIFLVLSSCVYGESVDIQGVYDKARQRVAECRQDQDEQDLLFQTYSQAIESADEKTLQENPELVFRRSKVWPDLDEPDNRMYTASMIHKDLQFVLEYAKKDSRLFMAAKEFDALVLLVMKGPYETDEEILQIIDQFEEKNLKPWATDASLSGSALREHVLEYLRSSPEVMRSFVDYIFLMEDEADIALGYIHPELLQVSVVYEEGKCFLLCEFEYASLGYEQNSSTILRIYL